jgi:ABC-2 type transport system permease protein
MMSFLCGIFFKVDQIPAFLRWIPKVLPLTYLVDLMRGIANAGTSLFSDPTGLSILTVWLAAPLLVSGFAFRRFLHEGE